MTQGKHAQPANSELASTPRATGRTLAQRNADLEKQIRVYVASDPTVALTEPARVRERMKELRQRAGNPSQYAVAHELNVPPRTFQSWENAEVETDRENYEKVAAYYSRKLGQAVTANWILFGRDEAPPLPTPDLLGQFNGDAPQWAKDLDEKLDIIIGLLHALGAVLPGEEAPPTERQVA